MDIYFAFLKVIFHLKLLQCQKFDLFVVKLAFHNQPNSEERICKINAVSTICLVSFIYNLFFYCKVSSGRLSCMFAKLIKTRPYEETRFSMTKEPRKSGFVFHIVVKRNARYIAVKNRSVAFECACVFFLHGIPVKLRRALLRPTLAGFVEMTTMCYCERSIVLQSVGFCSCCCFRACFRGSVHGDAIGSRGRQLSTSLQLEFPRKGHLPRALIFRYTRARQRRVIAIIGLPK